MEQEFNLRYIPNTSTLGYIKRTFIIGAGLLVMGYACYLLQGSCPGDINPRAEEQEFARRAGQPRLLNDTNSSLDLASRTNSTIENRIYP